jgi:hypothetical protein
MVSRLLLSVVDLIVAYFIAAGAYFSLISLGLSELEADAIAIVVYLGVFYLIYYRLIRAR